MSTAARSGQLHFSRWPHQHITADVYRKALCGPLTALCDMSDAATTTYVSSVASLGNPERNLTQTPILLS